MLTLCPHCIFSLPNLFTVSHPWDVSPSVVGILSVVLGEESVLSTVWYIVVRMNELLISSRGGCGSPVPSSCVSLK